MVQQKWLGSGLKKKPIPEGSAGAADKLETMMNGSQLQANIFFPRQPRRIPALWLQAKLTISLTSIQDKFAKLFMTIAAELWLRGRIETLEAVFEAAARNFTIRLAEKLAKYLCSLCDRLRPWPPQKRNASSTKEAQMNATKI